MKKIKRFPKLTLRHYLMVCIGSSLVAFGIFAAITIVLTHIAFTLMVAVWALSLALVIIGWELVRQATRSMREAVGWIIFMLLLP